jgi:hypothetical protein
VTPITCKRDQSGDDRDRDYGHRIADGRRGIDFQSSHHAGIAGNGRSDGGGVQRHDVSDDGTGRGPAGAARDLRNSEYFAVFPQRIDLSGASVSRLAAGDRVGGSVHLCGAWIQVAAVEGSGTLSDCSRPAFSVDLCIGNAGVGGAIVQADSVEIFTAETLSDYGKGNGEIELEQGSRVAGANSIEAR